MPIRVIRYKCKHCSFTSSIKKDTKSHEGECLYNPRLKGCKTCYHGACLWCKALEKSIFLKDKPIRDCPYWNIPVSEIKDKGGY